MMRISVALCTYNGGSYLDEQLESLVRQTRLPDELIVSDDCSVDNTVLRVEKFARRAPFPVTCHINTANLGSCKNFELAIGRCSGDIIALCDQDDVWLPHKLSDCEEVFLGDQELGLVFGDAELVDENLRPLGKRLWDYTFPVADRNRLKRGLALQVLSRQNVITGATMAFRSCYRKACFPIPALEGLIHDYWIALVIASHAKIDFLPKPLIKYRQHSEQQIGVPAYLKPVATYSESIALMQKVLLRIGELKEDARKGQYALDEAGVSMRKEDSQSLLYQALADHETHLRDRCAHYEVRQKLPRNRWHRAPAVLRELSTRRYTSYSRGLLSALKDLLQ
jgi:glycosyltransferase involved in cell wall biosynthesis